MLKRIFKDIIVFICLITLGGIFFVLPAKPVMAAPYPGGSGTIGNPYWITSDSDWETLMTTPVHWALHFILTANIDVTGTKIIPVGNNGSEFSGSINGNLHTITTNMFDGPYDDIGIFGYNTGSISNMVVTYTGWSANATYSTGGLVGYNCGTITNCCVIGDVSGFDDVGGLVGYNEGTITGCYTSSNVDGDLSVGGLVGYSYGGTISSSYSLGIISGLGYVGGLVGESEEVAITDCYSNSNVTGIGYIGGLVGFNLYSTITSCYTSGNVSGMQGVGGLVGFNGEGNITSCNSSGDISGGDIIGGLAGANIYGVITACSASGNVSGDEAIGGLVGYNVEARVIGCQSSGNVSGLYDVGGLVGDNEEGTIATCYSSGNVTGDEYTGGLVGYSYLSTISDCYSFSAVTGNDYVGGLVGFSEEDVITNCYAIGAVASSGNISGLACSDGDSIVIHSYWDTQTTGQAASDCGEGRTTDDMTYIYAVNTYVSWDFHNVWIADATNINGGYPYLNWQIPPEMSVWGNGVEIANGDIVPAMADHTYFGGAFVGYGATVYTFTVKNTGLTELELTGVSPYVTIEGDIDHNFSLSSAPSTSIEGCDYTTFQITFIPTTEGLCTATLTISNNDGNENPYSFSISGLGVYSPLVVDDTIYISGGEIHLELGVNGQTQHTYGISSFDHHLNFTIPRGTIITDGQNTPMDTITITAVISPPAPPAGVNFIGPVFDLGPDGAVFNPPLVITFSYSDLDVPAGVDEGSLRICFYNESTGQWVECECTVDTVNNVITATLFHFSQYAVMPHVSPLSFTVSNLTIGQSVSVDQAMVFVSVDIVNTGVAGDLCTLTLKVNGIVTETKDITLAGGAVGIVSFVLTNQSAGAYNVEVNGLTGSYEISPPPVTEPAITTAALTTTASLITAPANPSPVTVPAVPETISGSWIFGIIAGAGLVFILIIWRVTRRAR
jgi:hypothetical protein